MRRGLLLAWAVPVFVIAPEALGAPYIAQAGLPSAAVGAWLVVLPLGNLIGALLGVWWLTPRRRRQMIGALAAAGPALLIPVAIIDHIAISWLFVLACGLASAYGLGLDQYLFDTTPKGLLARMLTLQVTG